MTRNIDFDHARAWLPPRPADCHKGDFGSVGILGGATGMVGAALLAARAALWLGAGHVYCALLDERVAVDGQAPELMLATPEWVLAMAAPGCLVVGPGLGLSTAARDWLEGALDTELPLILDADALNLVAGDADLARHLVRRTTPTLLTPHPGEAARLLASTNDAVQGDRPAAVRDLAHRYGTGVVLKGAGSLVLFPAGEIWRSTSGNPGMAAPGMGDVLAGMIASLVAQGLGLERAALLAVCLHGAAGDALAEAGDGPLGMTAGELARVARRLLNRPPTRAAAG